MVGFGLGPRVVPGADDRRALCLGVHVMRRAHDQHNPSVEGFRIVLVDLEGDLVLSVRDPGPQVLFGEGVLEGARMVLLHSAGRLAQGRRTTGSGAAG
jgi:hypothetical protein